MILDNHLNARRIDDHVRRIDDDCVLVRRLIRVGRMVVHEQLLLVVQTGLFVLHVQRVLAVHANHVLVVLFA